MTITPRMRKRRIGMICLATVLPLVADEACRDDRMRLEYNLDDLNNNKTTTAHCLFPFEASYGTIRSSTQRTNYHQSHDEEASHLMPWQSQPTTNMTPRHRQTRSRLALATNNNASNTKKIQRMEASISIPPESSIHDSTIVSSPEPQPPDDEINHNIMEESTEDHQEIHKVDYASKSVGAILLESSKHIKGTNNLLQKDQDLYAIVPCESLPMFITIGLSEDILVKQLKLSNYERYSGSMRSLQIYASTDLKLWHSLGKYELLHQQLNSLELRHPIWARYLKLEFLEYYGQEHYCTISQISVFGSTMLQGFHEQWDQSGEEELLPATIMASDDGRVESDASIGSSNTAATTAATSQTTIETIRTEPMLTSEPEVTTTEDDEICQNVDCGDDIIIDSLSCFEQLVLRNTERSEHRRTTQHWCYSSSFSISRSPGTKSHPIQAVSTQNQQIRHSQTNVADLEPPSPVVPLEEETPPVDPILHALLQRFPHAKCLEQMRRPILKSSASPGHSANQDIGLEPIFTKFSAEIKALQSDVLALTEYTKLSSDCYQSLLLESIVEQQNIQREHAERLAALERESHRVWYAYVKDFFTTSWSDALNSEHGKRLGSVLTSAVWNDGLFCGAVCALLLAVFLYLGGSRYQGRITIRRQQRRQHSLLESTDATNADQVADETSKRSEVTPVAVVSSSEGENATVAVSQNVPNETRKRRKRKMGLKSVLR